MSDASQSNSSNNDHDEGEANGGPPQQEVAQAGELPSVQPDSSMADSKRAKHFQLIFDTYLKDRSEIKAKGNQVLRDLQSVLGLAHIRIYKFGSMVTNLNVTGSDCDFYVDRLAIHRSHFTLLEDVEYYMLFSDLFQKIIHIRKAKVPIVKCIHKATGMSVDINSTAYNGLYNTAMIAAVVRSDRRLQDFLIFLKIWGKEYGLVGTNKMTNYCLAMLGIFFLQQPQSGRIVPALDKLFAHSDVDYSRYGSADYQFRLRNGGFSIPDTFSTWSAVRGFFKYYSALEFDAVMVCPSLGYLLPREDDQEEAAVWVTEVEIQNDEWLNMARSISTKHFAIVKAAISQASVLCEHRSDILTPEDIYSLMVFGVLAPRVDMQLDDASSVLKLCLSPSADDMACISEYVSKSRSSCEANSVWMNHLMKIAYFILTEIMLGRVVKQWVPSGHADRVEEYLLLVKRDMWTGRQFNVPPGKKPSRLDTQVAETAVLLQKLQRRRVQKYKTHVLLMATMKSEPPVIGLEFRCCTPYDYDLQFPLNDKARKFVETFEKVLKFYSIPADIANGGKLLFP